MGWEGGARVARVHTYGWEETATEEQDVPRDDVERTADHPDRGNDDAPQRTMYLRFAAMILTGMVVTYWVMFVGSWEWSHVAATPEEAAERPVPDVSRPALRDCPTG